MTAGDYFVVALMILNAGACLAYGWQGHYWKAGYWFTVFLLNLCLLNLK